jgi:hypothetical protein
LGIGPAAPHQQASLRNVEAERTSEEARLQNAWSNAGQELRDDPGSDDERTVTNSANGQSRTQQDEQAVRLNGGMTADGDDSDLQDADVEEDMDDDDMMDKISSSPSIDDGGYFLPSPPPRWPQRIQSLTPESSPLRSPCASSSPFTTTPLHFPLSVASARRHLDVPAPDSQFLSNSSPLSTTISISQFQNNPPAEHHRGEYAGTRASPEPEYDYDTDSDSGLDMVLSPRSKMRRVIERRLQSGPSDSSESTTSDLDNSQASRPLVYPKTTTTLPDLEDPSPGPTASPPRTTNGTPPPRLNYPSEEDDAWTTDSDADSWDQVMDDDDASNEVSFSEDPRFIDSGWGGECLRETEDIDFEFVYALHTFVATVEGQANATKGDTMVLLDDSNSYWWLVRVVKDSSIGAWYWLK